MVKGVRSMSVTRGWWRRLVRPGRMRSARYIERGGGAVGAGRAWWGALLLTAVTLIPSVAHPATVHAAWVETTGEVVGADVEGTIWLSFDSAGGGLTGRIEMTVQFDCRGKLRDERHVMELTKGRVDGDRIIATAVYVERSGLPKDELARCKSAYETYQTREDSRRLIGTIDVEGQRASGTLGEYRPTVSWRIAWEAPAPELVMDDSAPAEGEPMERVPAEREPNAAP